MLTSWCCLCPCYDYCSPLVNHVFSLVLIELVGVRKECLVMYQQRHFCPPCLPPLHTGLYTNCCHAPFKRPPFIRNSQSRKKIAGKREWGGRLHNPQKDIIIPSRVPSMRVCSFGPFHADNEVEQPCRTRRMSGKGGRTRDGTGRDQSTESRANFL